MSSSFGASSPAHAGPGNPPQNLIIWTFGRGSAIWRIWPAVLFHTLFATVIVSVSLLTPYNLAIPGILLNVLGVVIGFVISYRASSGYERYWLGRGCWSDIIQVSRTMTRLVWFHVPIHTSKNLSEDQLEEDALKVMEEKKQAVQLIYAFSVALKHHIRGEDGIHYEDLYHLVKPLHRRAIHDARSHYISPTTLSPPIRSSSTSETLAASSSTDPSAYGTFRSHARAPSRDSSNSDTPLLHNQDKSTRIAGELIPFTTIWDWLRGKGALEDEEVGGIQRKYRSTGDLRGTALQQAEDPHLHLQPIADTHKMRPRIVGGGHGENVPQEIIRELSKWLAVLENRGNVSVGTISGLMANVTAFEQHVSALEKILTTPLPFVYSVHIRHTVWLYLFSLPFQLVSQFRWFTILGVFIASFIYLGFVAAGEEIEQPFGYDENDLDLDLFCQDVIGPDLAKIMSSSSPNVYFKSDAASRSKRSREATLISGETFGKSKV